jgi:hypothetical protein
MSPRRLVIVGQRNDRSGFGDLRLGQQINAGANETKKLAKSGLARTAVTGNPSSTQRLQRLELVVGRTPEDAALEASSHQRDRDENSADLGERVQTVELLQIAAVLDGREAHVPPAHVLLGDMLSRSPPVRVRRECHEKRVPRGVDGTRRQKEEK